MLLIAPAHFLEAALMSTIVTASCFPGWLGAAEGQILLMLHAKALHARALVSARTFLLRDSLGGNSKTAWHFPTALLASFCDVLGS